MTTRQHRTSMVPSAQRIVATVRDDLRERRAQRAAARELARDLSTYTTPREIEDLLATLDRSEDAGVEPMRAILVHNLHTYQGGRLAS